MFAVFVAWRYLFSNVWQSLLLVAGVALGVTAYVFITALVQGVAIRLTEDVTANSAHIVLEPPTGWCQANANPSPKFAHTQVLGYKKVAPFAKSGVPVSFEG